MIETDIDIYRAYIENESITYSMYFTYEPSSEEVIERAESMLSMNLYVFDIFPEISNQAIELEEDMSVMSSYGVGININKGTKISLFDTFRILFGEENE